MAITSTCYRTCGEGPEEQTLNDEVTKNLPKATNEVEFGGKEEESHEKIG